MEPKFSVGEIALVQSVEGGRWRECEIIEYLGGKQKSYLIYVPGYPSSSATGNWWTFEICLRKKKGPDAREWFEKNIKIKEVV